MKAQTAHFHRNIQAALNNAQLQQNMGRSRDMFVNKRQQAFEAYPYFQQARQLAADIKQQVLDNLDDWLIEFERNALNNGSEVLWASDAQSACQQIAAICQEQQAKTIIKSKSMLSEEIDLNSALEETGARVIETDLGEYVLQLSNQAPSHIVAPMIHMHRQEVSELFVKHHQSPPTNDIHALTLDARKHLRQSFLNADIGITGANFLLADCGAAVMVENEGNGRLSMTLPKTRIVLVGIEKLIPNFETATLMLSLLSRSATGQAISNYVSITKQPHASDDDEGPKRLIYVLVDAGRAELLKSDSRDMLRCIRCGACMNHCPVYQNVGGHAYGWVYPGPMGSILTPYYLGLEKARDLPYAATLCGACDEVCPVKIPLTRLLRDLRTKVIKQTGGGWLEKISLILWSWLCRHPRAYRLATKSLLKSTRLLAGNNGIIRYLPGFSWSKNRNIHRPNETTTFLDWYRKNS